MARLFGKYEAPETLLGGDDAESKQRKEEEQAFLQKVEQESPTCGGTGHILPRERSKASFETLKLTIFLDGSPKATMHRRWLWRAGEKYDNSLNIFRSRDKVVSDHVERFIGIHQQYAEEGYIPKGDDIMMMTNASRSQGAFGLHYGAFCTTIMSQGSQEQVMTFGIPAVQMKIVGCLAQSELGHASNVRGLRTIAEYDPRSEEFVLNTPTLQSMKWWPGGLGKTATHCIVYANLVIAGKEYGFHSFMIQLRDENHKPLPGIELGEVGPKIGDNGTETGFMRLTNVRIPREWILSKNQTVEPDGTYRKTSKAGKASDKSQYTTMLTIRSGLVMGAGYRLAQAVTIACRYSCVRHQGFVDTTDTSAGRLAEERPIIDYMNQQYRVMKQLATAFAFIFTGKMISAKLTRVMEDFANDQQADLAGLHGVSSGLKALTTFEGAAGMEDLRKCCGGHGVLLSAGIAPMFLDYVTYNTAEGDMIVLELQAARFLLKKLSEAKNGEQVSGLVEYVNEYSNPSSLACKAATVEDFLNLQVLCSLFRSRAQAAVFEASELLDEKLTKLSFDEAWNSCAMELVRCSRVHCYYTLLMNFVEALETCQDAKVKAALSAVCQLYALANITEDLGSFELTRQQKVLVRSALKRVLPVVRSDCIALTDAFEFSDNILNSAIGKYDGRVYEALYASAKLSPLNKQDPFPGYHEFLRPILDLDFLKENKTRQRVGAMANL